jgi:hypothetical protein
MFQFHLRRDSTIHPISHSLIAGWVFFVPKQLANLKRAPEALDDFLIAHLLFSHNSI